MFAKNFLRSIATRALPTRLRRRQPSGVGQQAGAALLRNQLLLQNSMDGIHVLDIHGNVLEVNDAFCNMLGYTREEAARLNVADWDAHLSAEELRERVERLKDKSERFETVHRLKDGTLIDVEVSVSGLEIDGQNYIFCSSRDITRRKKAEKTLRLTQFALDNVSMTVAMMRVVDGRFIYVNDAACRNFGYSRDELLGMAMFDVDPEFSPSRWAELNRELKKGGTGPIETTHRARDGHTFPVEVTANVLEIAGEEYHCGFAQDITQRTKAAEALRASEAKFRILFDSANDGVMLLDLDGQIRDINRTGHERLGYTREEMIGRHIGQFDAPEFAARVPARLREIGNTGQIICESANVRRDRSVMPVEVSARLVELDGRQQILSILRDISDRKEEEEQFKLMIRTSLDGFWITDERGRFLEVNDAYCDLVGYSRKELLCMGIPDVEAIETPEDTARHLQQLMEVGSVRFETRHRAKDGRILDIEVSAKHTSKYGGKIYCFLRDITERKRAENSLRESAERLQAHIENSPLAVVAWDNDFHVTQWSGEAENMFGWSAAETAGKPIMDLHLIYDEDIPLVQQTMVKLASGARYVISSNRNVTKDGRIIHCEWYNSVLSNEDGTIASVMSQVLDVTARKRIERELMVMNDHLQQEVAMRTADLSALTAHIQKIAEIERANLARELHDELGSTLVGIGMRVGRLSGKISAPDVLQDVSEVQELVSRAVEIKRAVVNQLYPTVLDNFGLMAALEWQVDEFRRHTGIEVELVLPEEPVDVEHAFALAAYRITQECLTNIAKHADASRISVQVTASGGLLDLTISDNGKGLPEGTHTGGHGIFGMIERARYLGGSMEFESRTGTGTTAHLRLPLEAAKPVTRKRVLVVDDHAIFRDAIRHLLDSDTNDFSVAGEAGDGKSAVRMAVSEDWDIVLLDVSLPKVNGVAALEMIKAAKPELPVIMLSGHSESTYAEIAALKGAACYIEKGETEKLVEAMRRAILLQQSSQGTGTAPAAGRS